VFAGGLYLDLGRLRLADAEFKRAAVLDPSEGCLLSIAELYLEHDMERKAFSYLDRAAKSDSAPTLTAVAELFISAGHPAKGEPYLMRALALDPTNADTHMALALLLLQQEKRKEAEVRLEYAERMARLKPEFRETLERLRSLKERVREHPPERDPEGFKRIRAAYERLRAAGDRAQTDLMLIRDVDETLDLARLSRAPESEPLISPERIRADLIAVEAWLLLTELTLQIRTDRHA
jgi:tetratricopeptide (TPR) repeat protein